jgi:PAS domain S-box-containing protein
MNEEGEIIAANPAARSILGLTWDELRRRTSADPRWKSIREDGHDFPPEEHPSMVSLRTGKAVEGVVMGVVNPREGQYRWILINSTPQFKEDRAEPYQVFVTVSDITDRVRARNEERRSREMFGSLFGNMGEGVALHEVIYGPDGKPSNYRIIDTNPRYEAHVGIPREKAVGALATELYGTDTAPYLEEFCAVGETGVPYQFETYFPPLDKHFAISVAPLFKGQFATIFFDISDRKRIEAEREHFLSELERKNRELESIVYVASHDLRSPLVNIQGFGLRIEKQFRELAEAARRVARTGGAPAESAAAQHAAAQGAAAEDAALVEALVEEKIPLSLGFIQASAHKMDGLIAGLLKLSRTGRAELRIEALDMNKLLGDIAAAMAFQLERTGALLSVDPLPPCRGDADQLNQVFSNLLDNAIKYRDPSRRLEVRIRGEAAKEGVEYSVEDNGIGIGKDYFDKVFEIFSRLDPKDGLGGEGLGLTLVRRILDRNKGKIWVESEPGRGSVFHVLLPAPLKVVKEGGRDAER